MPKKVKYRIDMKPSDCIVLDKLHHQLNGLQKLSNGYDYSGECLLLKFSKSGKWLHYTIFQPIEKKGSVAISQVITLKWLYHILKDDLDYQFIETIFPSTVFN